MKKFKFPKIKISKKNVIIICAVALICGAIYLNWVFFSDNSLTPANIDTPFTYDNEILGQASYVDSNAPDEVDSYFAISQINRKRSRHETIEVLQTIIDSEDAMQDLKNKAADEISKIASNIENEANIETLVVAKGFKECVAVLGQENASIIVKSSGLMPNEIIQIKEIVYEQAGIMPSNIKIIEKAE